MQEDLAEVVPETEVVDVLDGGEVPDALEALLVGDGLYAGGERGRRLAVCGAHEDVSAFEGPGRCGLFGFGWGGGLLGVGQALSRMVVLHRFWLTFSEEYSALCDLISPVGPFGTLVCGHAGIDEVDVVSQETERERPCEEREKPDSCRRCTAFVDVQANVDQEVVELLLAVCGPAGGIGAWAGLESVPVFISCIVLLYSGRQGEVYEVCTV